MKALIRKKGETITEKMNVPCIDWSTGHPLTNPEWFGGPYKLVQNYVPPVDDEPALCKKVVEPEQVEIDNDDNYVIIEGKKYNKTELRSLLE